MVMHMHSAVGRTPVSNPISIPSFCWLRSLSPLVLFIAGILHPFIYIAGQPPEVAAVHAAAGAVSGLVVDAQSGSPLKGVPVRLVRFHPASPKLETASADDGTFSFDSVPAGKAHLWLGDGYVVADEDPTNPGAATMVNVGAASPNQVRLPAAKGLSFAGRALDVSSGRPLPGLRLCIVSALDGTTAYSEDVTSDDGSFSLTAIKGGKSQLCTIPTRYFICLLRVGSSAVLESEIENAVVGFARVSRVEGHVSGFLPGDIDEIWVELFARTVKRGDPAEGFHVYPRCDVAKISPGERFVLHAFGAPPDAQGSLKTYVLGKAEGQSVPIRLYAGGSVDGVSVPLKLGCTTGAVKGAVLDENGDPIPWAFVQDESRKGKLVDWEPATYTNSKGKFILFGIPASVGRRTLFVTAPGYQEAKARVKVRKGALTDGVDIVLKGTGLGRRWWVLHPAARQYAPPTAES